MKKVKSLQLLVYLVFGLLVLNHSAAGFLKGFKEGFEDGRHEKQKDSNYRGDPALHVALAGNYFTPQQSKDLKIDDKYMLEDIVVNADVRVNHDKVDPAYVTTWLSIIAMFGVLIIMLLIALRVNAVIKQIVEGNMFEWKCIKLIRNTGVLMLLYIIVDFAYQQFDYMQQVKQIGEPLKVINTSTFDFTTLILAILVFIVAEAFKQGARLKEEQSLVI